MSCLGNYNLSIQQNATFTQLFTWLAGACCGATGSQPAPVDLTGYTAAMQIRPYPLSSTVLYDASGDITLGGTTGQIALSISAADTATFTWWSAVYDLVLTSPAGYATRLLSGAVSVCPGVTPVGGEAQYVLLPGGQAAIVPVGQGILTP